MRRQILLTILKAWRWNVQFKATATRLSARSDGLLASSGEQPDLRPTLRTEVSEWAARPVPETGRSDLLP